MYSVTQTTQKYKKKTKSVVFFLTDCILHTIYTLMRLNMRKKTTVYGFI